MIVVTLSRRPLSEGSVAANVLKHGCGGINVDATRIHTTENLTGGAYAKEGTDRWDGAENWRYKRQGGAGEFRQPTGRWPANLVLEHLAGCHRRGTRKVRGTGPGSGGGYKDGKYSGQAGLGDYTRTAFAGFADVDGTETVEAWDCEPGCPVAALDEQSGEVRAGGRVRGSEPSAATGTHTYGSMGRVTGPDPYQDAGGASRYFKQVGGSEMGTENANGGIPQDLLDYLHTLITPTHVGGESLVALDLNAVDWAAIPDGRYHGFIGRGEPTPEQVEHIWRVVKPGAHVLLIAPEDCPTGHRGACALEDRGFEIRDAILWVREAGKLHYVPKANTRERNVGCELLAQKRKGPPIYELTEEALSDEEAIGELQEVLLEAGVAEEAVEAIVDNGLPKDQIPKEHKHLFRKREGGGRYGNHHPTVKSVGIMEALLRDVPEGATVLDPFMGSGSTALACIETGHDFIGIEREAEYLEVADARVHGWANAKFHRGATVIESEALPPEKGTLEANGPLFDLFDDE